MASSYYPKIVTNGLILYLDAANPDSFQVGGNTFNDLSENGINGTLINTPTYVSCSLGSIYFDGNNKSIDLNSHSKLQFTNTQAFSISSWFLWSSGSNAQRTLYSYALSGGRGYYITLDDTGVVNTNGVLFDYYDGTNFKGIQTGNNVVNKGEWVNITCTCDTSNTSAGMKIYINGSQVITSNRAGVGTPSSINYSGLTPQIGYRQGSLPHFGNISQLSVYNKELTASEILQNYQCLKSRFSQPDRGKVVFSYTGATQYFTVPRCTTSISVKLWGAGGGGRGANGGGGGFTSAILNVVPGSIIPIIVGQGGNLNNTRTFGGGGLSYSDASKGGGSGGGRSAILNVAGTADLLVAGGGGGGGNFVSGNTGGVGGGSTGGNGSGSGAGTGGTQSAGGAGGSGTGGTAGSGTLGQGGDGTAGWAGGGGGGGYYGGGGAGGTNNNHGGGGGGSGYAGGAGTLNGSTIAGSGTSPGNTTDPDYISGVGVGGTSNGGNGLVVISY